MKSEKSVVMTIYKASAKIGIFSLTLLASLAITLYPVEAATARTSPSPSPSPVPKVPVPIIVGTVNSVTDSAITVSGTDGQSTTLTIGSTTKFEAPQVTAIKTKPSIKNVAANDTVAVGTLDNQTASFITIAAKGALPTPKRKVFLGVVSSREATSSGTILSLKHPKKDEFAKVLVNTNTGITAKNIEKPSVDDIKASDKVIVTGPTDDKDIINARKLYLIPGKARGLLEHLQSLTPNAASRSASPSAAAKASASPSPSARATATPRP